LAVRKLPKRGTEESNIWCKQWDEATHLEKLKLCEIYGVSYSTGKDYRSSCKSTELVPVAEVPQDSTWEEHINVLKQINKLIAFHQQVPTELSMKIDTSLPIAVTFVSDMHIGAFGVDYDSLERDCNTIEKEPGLYAVIGGDGYHNIIQPSKIGSSHNQAPIASQKGLYVLTLKKLLSKILFVGVGQHNYWTTLLEGEDWDGELMRRLHLVYTKHAALVNLKVGDFVYGILRMHKSRFRSAFNLTHTCKRNQQMYFPNARVVVIEDQHVGTIEQYRYNESECLAIRTGTYDVYDDYALSNGFFGAHVCNPTVVLFPDRDHLVGFKDMYDAITYLRAVRKNYEQRNTQ